MTLTARSNDVERISSNKWNDPDPPPPLLIFSLRRQYHPSVFFSLTFLLDSTGSKESYLTYSIKSISKGSAGEGKKERAARIHQDKHSDESNSLFPRYIRWSACKRNKRVGKMINQTLFIWNMREIAWYPCTFPGFSFFPLDNFDRLYCALLTRLFILIFEEALVFFRFKRIV